MSRARGFFCESLPRISRTIAAIASYCIAPAASGDARRGVCAMCGRYYCIALSLQQACVCGTFRCIAGPSSRATSAGCMLLGVSGCLLSVSLRRRANLHVSLDAAAHNVTLTAILLQFLRYRARSRPPRTSPSHSKSTAWLSAKPRLHGVVCCRLCHSHSCIPSKESSRLEGLASGLAMSLGNWDP